MTPRERRRGKDDLNRVLVVDDEADIRELLDMTLARMGLAADCAGSLAEARRLLEVEGGKYRLCLTDMRLPDGEGLELVRYIGESRPDLPVAVITAHGSMENAVSVLKAGAFDYLSKPVSLDQVRALVHTAIKLPSGGETPASDLGQSLLGESTALKQVRSLIERVARSQAPIYISGESGSGKELAARLIHRQGARSGKAFIGVNCGAIPENLMESEFFGVMKGAFTGAQRDAAGLFEQASGGTLFLDEVGEMPKNLQAKLLRVIQEKKVRRLGGQNEIAVDVRLIAASNKDLRQLINQGTFREDLYYRLAAITVEIPPLRGRREDIPLLADYFLKKFAETHHFPKTPAVGRKALKKLMQHRWPGNVRELEHVLTNACLLREGVKIDEGDIQLVGPVGMAAADGEMGKVTCLFDEAKTWNEYETEMLHQIVARFGGNKSRAAKCLKLSRTTLIKKIGDSH